ncbi:hypothetical protein RDI58_000337 [Solanum bulbocastanum]|uniref:Uncharacterized protein n=1 Tax=Solanum bulbocastanum TaxID=147425 RepID=A0AAN8UC25_SOLBU
MDPSQTNFKTNSYNNSGRIGYGCNTHLHDTTNTQNKPIILGQNGSSRPLSHSACLDGQTRNDASDSNSSFLTQIVLKGMSKAMETYNSHLWMSTTL